MGEVVCKVTRKVYRAHMCSFGTGVPPPLWEGGWGNGEVNSSKTCLRGVNHDFSQLDHFRMVNDYKLIKATMLLPS